MLLETGHNTMRIVMFSINPIFPDVVTGGASKHLKHIAGHLGSMGNHVEILCASADDLKQPFTWGQNVTVSPVLPFHLPFPQPYAVSGAALGRIVSAVAEALVDADRFYIHDGELLIPDIYHDIPTVISFRDNNYPESVLGTFIDKPDNVICVSEYSAEVIKHTAGLYYKGLNERIHVVNNGIDFSVFRPVDTHKIASELNIKPDKDLILLHPHRPEPGKGLPETIRVVDKLVHQNNIKNIKVLILDWITSMMSEGDAGFYQEMIQMMHALKVRENFLFIPWLPNERMPEYYSLGKVTLSLGNIVEAFGNVAYESIACGTPSIVACVGAHRNLLPDDKIEKVNYGDIDEAVKRVVKLLSTEQTVKNARAFLKENFDFDSQVQAYADMIIQTEKREPIQFSLPKYDPDQAYRVAPWCFVEGSQIYHDFSGVFMDAHGLEKLTGSYGDFTESDSVQAGISDSVWQTWIDRTWIVPVSI